MAWKACQRMTRYDDIRQINPSLVESSQLTNDLHIEPGTSVYDVTGEKLGKVSRGIAFDERFQLAMGLLVPREYYVRKSAIIRMDATGIHRDVTKDEVRNSGWDLQPTESVEALGQQENHEEPQVERPAQDD
jgi:hypothetical protein